MIETKRDRGSGYERFENASALEDDPVVLPVSVPAEELQHLTGNDSSVAQRVEQRASTLLTVTRFLWQGGSPGDAWLHMTAAQVQPLCSNGHSIASSTVSLCIASSIAADSSTFAFH